MEDNSISCLTINDLQSSTVIVKNFESPSKIIVILQEKQEEYNNMKIYLNQFYHLNREKYRVNNLLLKNKIYCFYENGFFYRGEIKNVYQNYCLIKSIDNLNCHSVVFDNIFDLVQEFKILPKQCFTISMKLRPSNSKFWSKKCTEFCKMFNNQEFILFIKSIIDNKLIADLGDWDYHEFVSTMICSHLLFERRFSGRIYYPTEEEYLNNNIDNFCENFINL